MVFEGITRWRLFIPYAFMAFLFVLDIVVLPYPLSGVVKAPFLLMAFYYWSIYRPTLIPPLLVFCAGLAVDLSSGMPLGLNGGVFVALRWLVSDQRRFLMGQSFLVVWIGFCVVNFMALSVQWLVFGLTQTSWPPFSALFPPMLLGVVLFPPLCFLLYRTQKILSASLGEKRSLGSQRRTAGL